MSRRWALHRQTVAGAALRTPVSIQKSICTRVSCGLAPCRQYNFASTAYAATFGDFPAVDVVKLRQDTVAAIEAFDPSIWHADPLKTHIAGQIHADGQVINTIDAFEVVNGKQVVASSAVLDLGVQQRQR